MTAVCVFSLCKMDPLTAFPHFDFCWSRVLALCAQKVFTSSAVSRHALYAESQDVRMAVLVSQRMFADQCLSDLSNITDMSR